MSRSLIETALQSGLQALELELSAGQQSRLVDYIELLAHWNRAFNLTAITDPVEMVHRHLIDSLAILPWVEGSLVADAGTGAGLPGVPLAIARPDTEFVLVDSNGKKIRFLRQVRRELGLTNIEPVQMRLEDWRPERLPAQVVARALAPLPRLVEQTGFLLSGGAVLLAMKGRLAKEECEPLAGAYNIQPVELNVPGAETVRKLVIVRKK